MTTVGVGVGVGCDVAVGVGADVVVVPPPQAAKKRAATVANDRIPQNNRARLAKDVRYVFIRKNLLIFYSASFTTIHS
jgi:hypothetical protein